MKNIIFPGNIVCISCVSIMFVDAISHDVPGCSLVRSYIGGHMLVYVQGGCELFVTTLSTSTLKCFTEAANKENKLEFDAVGIVTAVRHRPEGTARSLLGKTCLFRDNDAGMRVIA